MWVTRWVTVLRDCYDKLYAVVRCNRVTSHVSSQVWCTKGRRFVTLAVQYTYVYVDDLIASLEHSANGCYVGRNFVGCIVYADDLLLRSACVYGLQNMLDMCYSYDVDNYITFNHKVSLRAKIRAITRVGRPGTRVKYHSCVVYIMAALHSRCGHYIFVMQLWPVELSSFYLQGTVYTEIT